MKSYQRADRVSGLIQQTLSELLAKKIKDPRLDLVVITDVKMSRDLRLARIFFTTSSRTGNKDEVLAALQHALGYIKRVLAGQLGLRYMPELRFFYDHSFEYGNHIDNLLKSIQPDDGIDNSSIKNQP